MRFILILILPLFLWAKSDDFSKTTQDIKDALNAVVLEYKAGNIEKAKTDTQNAYFGLFEDIEGAIRINLSAKKAYQMEKQFGEIRKGIKAGLSADDIQKKVDNLSAELDEVLPIILNGHKLVGEYSDGNKPEDSTNQSATNTQSNEFDLSSFAIQWRFVFESIKTNLDNAKQSYKNGNLADVKKYVEQAKFTNYRNTRLEQAIRQYVGSTVDSTIQNRMGKSINSINSSISPDEFASSLGEIVVLVYDAMKRLPADSASLAIVKMPKDYDKDSEQKANYEVVVKNISDKLKSAFNDYINTKTTKAMGDIQDIYFDEFEASGMENKVGALDVNLKTSIEGSFGHIVALMKSGAQKEEINTAINELDSKLAKALELLNSSNGGLFLFLSALTIILREGFEALIIVAAIVAYLIKTGNSSRIRGIVYSSVSVAVLLSFAVAWVMNLIFENAGQKRELLEGITMLVAVGLLFYVGFWLLSNASAKKWNAYIQGHVSESITKDSATALWFTVFLAVFREGAETVLFYQALIFDAHNTTEISMIIGGFVIGLVVLFVVYYIFKIFAIKIPIRKFFMFTSAIIFYMSVVFVGKGVLELVEGKIFVPTIINGLNFPRWASEWLGLQPYYESLLPQIFMVLALIIGIVYMKTKQNQS